MEEQNVDPMNDPFQTTVPTVAWKWKRDTIVADGGRKWCTTILVM